MASQVVDAPLEDVNWLTLGKACRVLGVDESTLRRWADSGHVHAFRTPGGHRRFAESEIQAFVAGRGRDPDGESFRDLGDMAVTRIRRQLHRRPMRDVPWYATVDETMRSKLRPLGRRLASLAAEYLSRRTRRTVLLETARDLGKEYGHELATGGLPLAQAVEAFIFFRRSLDDLTKQASQRHGLSAEDVLSACEQVHAVADQVLIGLTVAYEEPVKAPAAGKKKAKR